MISAVREDTQEHFDPEPTSARERVSCGQRFASSVGEVMTLGRLRSIAAAHARSQLHSGWSEGVAVACNESMSSMHTAGSVLSKPARTLPRIVSARESPSRLRSGRRKLEGARLRAPHAALTPLEWRTDAALEPARAAKAIRFCNFRARAACDCLVLCLGCPPVRRTWETS